MTIPNLVDLPSVQSALDGPWPLHDISPEAPFLLFAGKLDPNKGPQLLPATLGEALDALREDTLIRDTLGDSIYEGFLEAKSIEWTEYRKQVHAWELERYLPVF